MFQLFKQRDFGDIFNDTFAFLKANGKNYFRNYIIVNGPVLILLLVLTYLMGKVFYDAALTGFGANRIIEDFFNNNLGFFIGSLLGLILLFIILAMLNYSYPVLYLHLYEKNASPTTQQIVTALKNKAGKILLFALLWFISFLPVCMLAGAFSMLLTIIIIGIPFIFVLFAFIFCWMTLSFYDYLNTDNGYFDSFSNGFSMARSKFWTYSGATIVFIIIIYVIQLIVSLIPNLFGLASVFAPAVEYSSEEEVLSLVWIVMLVTFAITTIFNYLLGNLIYVSQGMIYYSNREESENQSVYNEIDSIGSDFE